MDGLEDRKWKRKKEKALASGNMENLYIACKELAEIHLRAEKFDEALVEYKEAEQAAEASGKKIDVAVANRMIGEVLCCMGEFDEAIKHQKKHLDFSREEGNLVEEQRALATLGRTYFVKAESFSNQKSPERQNALHFSQKFYKKSLLVCENLKNSVGHSQLMIMKVRLYLNLGLTLESEGKSIEAVDLYEKAIIICKKNEFWEDLCRGYSILGLVHFNGKNSASSLSAYDNALKIAAKLDNKIQLSCEILLAKADVLIDLNDLVGAKQILLKAYKLKTPNQKDRKDIERKTRIVVAMCNTEHSLISASNCDFKSRKDLHEKMADGFVALKNFSRAIDHYQKMLQCAISLGQSEKELIPCYVSLSQTYKDNKQYDLAVEYFKKELAVHSDNPAEACKTLMNLAEIADLQGKPMEEILKMYKEARSKAASISDYKLEVIVLETMIVTLKERGLTDLMEEAEKELKVAKCCISDSNPDEDENEDEDEDETEEEGLEIGADICLSDLTDSSTDDEEFDRPHRTTRKRCARPSILMKKNEKGETPLHVACAKGNLNQVKNLINQGHCLDVQDAVGWLPLHEACNHGHVKVVEELLNAGANINDRGGPGCEGITPLHDAASSGHLEVIDLLLDRGASPLVKTNKGETVLDCLLACRERVVSEQGKELDSVTLAHFESIVNRLRTCLETVGEKAQKPSKVSKITKKSSVDLSPSFRRVSNESGLRKSIDRPDNYLNNDVDDGKIAANEYQKTMKALRHRSSLQSENYVEPVRKKVDALLDSDDVVDDWLEDDLKDSLPPVKRTTHDYIGQTYRQSSYNIENKRIKTQDPCRSADRYSLGKRKRTVSSSSNEDLSNDSSKFETNRVKNSSNFSVSENIESGAGETSATDTHSNFNDDMGTLDLSIDDDDWAQFASADLHPPSPEIMVKKTNHRFQQRSLTSMNIITEPKFSSSNNKSNENNESTEFHNQSLHINPEPLQSPAPSQSTRERTTSSESIISDRKQRCIKVKVNEILLLVPLPQPPTNLKVSWLIKETVHRYQAVEGVIPELTLMTRDGALLSDEDSVAVIVDEGEIQAKVSSWKTVPLAQRFLENCSAAKIRSDTHIKSILESCEATFSLKIENCFVEPELLNAVFKSITHHYRINELILPGIMLEDDGMKLVAQSLLKLPQLRVLNLSLNNITYDGLEYLAEIQETSTWQNLCHLDLSFNPLGDECMILLSKILKDALVLNTLNLKACDFTQHCSKHVNELLLDNLEELDVSFNQLHSEGLRLFLSRLDPSRIQSVNIAATGSSDSLRELSIFFNSHVPENLKRLNVSKLNLEDSDVELLFSSIKDVNGLEYLDLSDSSKLTKKSFQLLKPHFKNLQTLLFSGSDFGDCDLQLSNSLTCLSVSSTSGNIPKSLRGPYNFVYAIKR